MKKEIIVYTNSTCGHCKAMKDVLKKEKIKFTEKLVSEHQEEWNLVTYITGLNMFPTINVGENYFIPGRDYNQPQQIVEYLKNIDKLNQYSDETKLLQAFKTLTFSVNNVFQRMFQQLEQLKQQKDEHKSTS